MRILITGGTGFVGGHVARALLARGDEVTLVSSRGRSPLEGKKGVRVLRADTSRRGDWQNEVDGHDAVINLAGRSVFHLWTEDYKQKIYSSRIHTTRNIVEAMAGSSGGVLLSASAAGYYGNSGDEEREEASEAGDDFLAGVCAAWEKEAFCAREKGWRVATMRFGVVLGAAGGALATMKLPFNLGLGGPIGSGRQYFPWIHIDDLVAAVLFLLDGGDMDGPYNFVAPEAVRQKEFSRVFGGVLRRPAFMPAPGFVIGMVLGDFGRSLLQGQKVVPRALEQRGFSFRFPRLEEALREALQYG